MWKENIKIDLEKMLEAVDRYYAEYRLGTNIAQGVTATDKLMTCLIQSNIANAPHTAAQRGVDNDGY